MCAVEKCCWNMSSSSCAIRMVAGLQPHLFFNIEYIITKKMWILYKHRYLHGLYKRIIKTAFNKKKKFPNFLITKNQPFSNINKHWMIFFSEYNQQKRFRLDVFIWFQRSFTLWLPERFLHVQIVEFTYYKRDLIRLYQS